MNRTLLWLLFIVMAWFFVASGAAQTLRQGQKLPAGSPRYYLRAGSVQDICAPYVADGKPAWSCAETAEVIKRILKDCEGEKSQ